MSAQDKNSSKWEKKESDPPKQNPHKIRLFSHNIIKKREWFTKKTEQKEILLQSEYEKKTSAGEKLKEVQENVDKIELPEAHSNKTMEKPILEQEMPIENYETVKTIKVDERQDIPFYISKGELEANEDKFARDIKMQTEERKASPLMIKEHDVEIKLEGIPVDNIELLETQNAKTKENRIVKQEISMEKHEAIENIKVDERQNIPFYMSKGELEAKEDKLTMDIKKQSKEKKATNYSQKDKMTDKQDVETKHEGVLENGIDQYVQNNPEIKMSSTKEMKNLAKGVSDINLEVNINQVVEQGDIPTETEVQQISHDDFQQNSQEPVVWVDQSLCQDLIAGNEHTPSTQPEQIFDKYKNAQNIPEKEPQSKSPIPKDLQMPLKITAQATNIETQMKETAEQELVNGESLAIRPEIPGKNTIADLNIVCNIEKNCIESDTWALNNKPSGTASEKGTQVNDIILRTHRIASVISTRDTQHAVRFSGEKKAKTSVEGIKSVTNSSAKSYKTHLQQRNTWKVLHEQICYPKISAHCDILTKSTRLREWWRFSREKKYMAMDHKISGKQTILVKSPSPKSQTTKIFKEVFPNINHMSDLVEAFQDAFEFFRKDKTKRVDMNDLQYSLSSMGIHLTHQDTFEALKSADIDGDGKMNFSDFFLVLTNNKRFSITVARRRLLSVSEQENLDIVLFDAISRLLQKCSLPKKSAAKISKYYREKYEAIPQLPKLEGSKSQVMMDFARGTRIMGMTDSQLVHYLVEIKAIKGSCIGSPYDVIPCVPLCIQIEKKLPRQPHSLRLMQINVCKEGKENSDMVMQKDVKGMTHRGIQVDIYIPEYKHSLNPITINLHLPFSKLQKLNMNDFGFVRHKVNIGKKCFLKRVTQKKLSSMLQFWEKILGDQIEQETKNSTFSIIFSTYFWTLDTQHELRAKEKQWPWRTKKHCETASAPLGNNIEWSYMDRYHSNNAHHGIMYQGKWKESNAKGTEVLNESYRKLPENPNVEQKSKDENTVQE